MEAHTHEALYLLKVPKEVLTGSKTMSGAPHLLVWSGALWSPGTDWKSTVMDTSDLWLF